MTIKAIIGAIVILVLAFVSGFSLAKDANACFLGFGCGSSSKPANYTQETKTLEQNQSRLIQSVPAPFMETSQERLNIKKRAETFNNENKISYIYLVNYGKVMAFYSVKGKVSSLRSYMTPQENLVDANGSPCRVNYSGSGSYEPCYQVQAPDIDGSYGDNADGIFFFTTEGAYVEWVGDYMMSDQPLKLTTQPELVRVIE